MKLSLVIPTRRIGDVLERAIKSMEGEYDNLIIVDEMWDNLGKKINYGLSQTEADYVVVCNDDIELTKGHLWNLCDPAAVVAPLVNGNMCKTFHAHMECFPRWVLDAGIKWPEDYDGFYYDDSDVWMQLIKHGVSVRQDFDVDIKHEHPGFTLGTLQKSDREKNNRDLFIKKWGIESLPLVGCI
jgi:glycosyltransferase involved in cell wall biosynthesis